MKYKPDDIFTPQGLLAEVEKNPNLDFLMNIFSIRRAFGVSGFGGNWNVGMHSMATAFIALYWAKCNHFPSEKRNRLVVQALVHDLHEAVTGDILPMFKVKNIKKRLQTIQENILRSLEVSEDRELTRDIKVIDLVAFLYEIMQVSPNILHPKKLKLAQIILEKQRSILFAYCKDQDIRKEKVQQLLTQLELA